MIAAEVALSQLHGVIIAQIDGPVESVLALSCLAIISETTATIMRFGNVKGKEFHILVSCTGILKWYQPCTCNQLAISNGLFCCNTKCPSAHYYCVMLHTKLDGICYCPV